MTPEPALSSRALREQADDVVRKLDTRERAVLVAIYEHKVLLTEHLKAMFFGSLRRTQDQLRHLAQRGLIGTWYPPQPRGAGKASAHHTRSPRAVLMWSRRSLGSRAPSSAT